MQTDGCVLFSNGNHGPPAPPVTIRMADGGAELFASQGIKGVGIVWVEAPAS